MEDILILICRDDRKSVTGIMEWMEDVDSLNSRVKF